MKLIKSYILLIQNTWVLCVYSQLCLYNHSSIKHSVMFPSLPAGHDEPRKERQAAHHASGFHRLHLLAGVRGESLQCTETSVRNMVLYKLKFYQWNNGLKPFSLFFCILAFYTCILVVLESLFVSCVLKSDLCDLRHLRRWRLTLSRSWKASGTTGSSGRSWRTRQPTRTSLETTTTITTTPTTVTTKEAAGLTIEWVRRYAKCPSLASHRTERCRGHK